MVFDKHTIAYVVIGTLTALLASFDAALAMGQVPIPHEWAWLAVIVQPALIYLTTQLKRLGAKEEAAATITVTAHPTPAPVVTVSTTAPVVPTEAPSDSK